MLKRIAVAVALTALGTAGHAQTVIGGATLIDTATVINGTVAPTTYLTFDHGSDGVTGDANGTSYNYLAITPSAAMATADHQWAQFDDAIVMHSNVALSGVIAIPAIDHGWTLTNSGPGAEPFEPFEFRIWGCGTSAFSSTACELGRITKVWTQGVDDVGASKNADDWTTQWDFNGSYNYFAVSSGDRLVGGPFSPGEGEIDALAAAPIPEPETYALFAAGLAALGLVSRRKRKQR